MTNSTRKLINTFIKVAILVLAAAFIFHKLNNSENIQSFGTLLKSLRPFRVYLVLAAVFLLMLLNWFLEAVKWRFLIKPIQKISVWEAITSVFCGLTLAVFTPNRIGEYGGRIFFLSPRRRILGIIAMGVGAIGQMVVTNVLGAIALFWFIGEYLAINIVLYYGIFVLVVIYCLFFLLLYFKIGVLQTILNDIKFLRRFQKFFKVLARYQLRDLFRVFTYSVLRFVVFTSQYCLVIGLLIPEISVLTTIMMVFILFFIQSALPSLDLLDVGVRTITATYFFGFATKNEVAIMAATASIWLINLIIPAILGSVFVFKLNVLSARRN